MTTYYLSEPSTSGSVNDNERKPQCPDGFTPEKYYGLCVSLQNKPLSWTSARTVCKSMGSDLLSMADVNSRPAILSYLFLDNVVTDGVWIGYHRISSTNITKSDFIWSDGTSSNNPDRGGSLDTAENWASGNPSDKGDCVHLLPNSSRNAGKMATDHCEQLKPFVCAKNGHLPPPAFDISGGCGASEYLGIIGLIVAMVFIYFALKFVYYSMLVSKTRSCPVKTLISTTPSELHSLKCNE